MVLKYDEPKNSYHFKGRLFDRDTLFVLQYQINFLFVLNTYTSSNSSLINEFRIKTKNRFRDNFIDYLNTPDKCKYEIYERQFEIGELPVFFEKYFRILHGKCITIDANKLLIGKHIDDRELEPILVDFRLKKLQ